MSKKNEIKPTFKIHEVNRIRAIRTNEFIRVQVFEDGEPAGLFWQSPELIKKNIKQYGEDSYLNLNEHKSLLHMNF
jgi:hypothetical protein